MFEKNGKSRDALLEEATSAFGEAASLIQFEDDVDSVNLVGGDKNKGKAAYEENKARRHLLIEETVNLLTNLFSNHATSDETKIALFKQMMYGYLTTTGLKELDVAYKAALNGDKRKAQKALDSLYDKVFFALKDELGGKTFFGETVAPGTGEVGEVKQAVRSGLVGLDVELKKLGIAQTGAPADFAVKTHNTVYPIRPRARKNRK